MRTLIAIAIFTYFLSACQDKNQSPDKTVQDFHEAQSAVHDAVILAAPHVSAMANEVIKPAADQVLADAAAQKAAGMAAVSGVPAAPRKHVASIGLEYTNAIYCYNLPKLSQNAEQNVECYSQPQPNKERK